jgi:MFS family permease
MTPAARDRIERHARTYALVAAASVVLCLLGPMLVVLVAAVVQGIATGSPPPNGGLVWSEGFPPFDPQLWLIWIPIAVMAAWILITFPVPLRRTRGFGRLLQFLFLVLTFVGTLILIAGFYAAPWIAPWGTEWAPTAILWVGAVLVVRVVLGWLRLLPRSWRVYLDENGDPEPERPYGPGSGPLSKVPQ